MTHLKFHKCVSVIYIFDAYINSNDNERGDFMRKTNRKFDNSIQDLDYLLRQGGIQLTKYSRLHGRVVIPKPSKSCFKVRVIKDPYELLKMGYSPSQNCWKKYFESENLLTPVNDYDVGEEFKKVA